MAWALPSTTQLGTDNSRALFKSLSPPNRPGGFRCSQVYPQPRWPVQERGVPAGVANVKKMWDHRFRGRDTCMSRGFQSRPRSLSTPDGTQMPRRSQSLIVQRPRSSCSPSQGSLTPPPRTAPMFRSPASLPKQEKSGFVGYSMVPNNASKINGRLTDKAYSYKQMVPPLQGLA